MFSDEWLSRISEGLEERRRMAFTSYLSASPVGTAMEIDLKVYNPSVPVQRISWAVAEGVPVQRISWVGEKACQYGPTPPRQIL